MTTTRVMFCVDRDVILLTDALRGVLLLAARSGRPKKLGVTLLPSVGTSACTNAFIAAVLSGFTALFPLFLPHRAEQNTAYVAIATATPAPEMASAVVMAGSDDFLHLVGHTPPQSTPSSLLAFTPSEHVDSAPGR